MRVAILDRGYTDGMVKGVCASILTILLAVASVPGTAASRQDPPLPSAEAEPLKRPTGLAGTKWRLAKIEYGNDTRAEPDDPDRYTIEFLPEGQVAVQADCNRGRGSYTADGPRLSLNVLAYTRAMCPPGSLFDQYSQNLNDVVSYILKGDQLHLAMKMDAGILTFDRISPVETP
jgi:heat shock protein HslJ